VRFTLSTHGIDVLVALTESEEFDEANPLKMIPFASVRRGIRLTMIRSLGGTVSALVRRGLVRTDHRGKIGLTPEALEFVGRFDPDVKL